MKTSKPLLTLRMLFPAAASFIVLLLGEWIARGSLTADTFISFIFPHFGAYLLAWLLLFLVWELLDWVLRYPAACYAGHGRFGLCALRSKLLYHAAAGRALPAVGPDAGVRRPPVWPPLPGSSSRPAWSSPSSLVLALTVGSFFLYRGRQQASAGCQRLAGSARHGSGACAC